MSRLLQEHCIKAKKTKERHFGLGKKEVVRSADILKTKKNDKQLKIGNPKIEYPSKT